MLLDQCCICLCTLCMVLQAVEWTDTSMHFHDPLYSGSERWTPSPRPSSEGLLLFCRPASNDPSVTPRGTPSTAEPLDFTLSPLGTPTPPTLPVTLFEECSRCSGAGPSRRSSHLSQASMLSLSAPACAQDAIMSFDTLFSTVSSAQMLDSFSCQAVLQVTWKWWCCMVSWQTCGQGTQRPANCRLL